MDVTSPDQPEGDPSRRELLERLPFALDRPWIGFAVAVVGACAAAGIRFVAPLPTGFPFLTFFPAVVLVALFFGLRAGLVTAFISATFAWLMFIRPDQGSEVTPGTVTAMLFYWGVIVIDLAVIFWMQTAFARLSAERRRTRALADTRELLFRELQHRVSNNLQVVGALLALQKRDIDDERARHALDEASRRLGMIGRIHRQLYAPGGGRLGLAAFLTQLARDSIETAGGAHVSLDVQVAEGLDLPPDAAIPVALIVTEAVANAVEHGFGGGKGAIRVEAVRLADGGARLSVVDDGCGLPDGFDLDHSGSLGLRIAATLSRQLGGRFELVRAKGTIARLTLPAGALA